MGWLQPAPQAPRLVVRIMGVSFVVITGVLSLVFAVLSWQAETGLARMAADDLERSQQWFAEVEARRTRERRLQATALAENPTLKAAVDTYLTETTQGTPSTDLLPTIDREVEKLARVTGVPALVVTDLRNRVLSAGGPDAADWSRGELVHEDVSATDDDVVISRGERLYLATKIPMLLGSEAVGAVLSPTRLDDSYARTLGAGAHADVVVVHNGQVVASSMPADLRRSLAGVALPESGMLRIDQHHLVVRRLSTAGTASVHAVSSVDSAASATKSTLTRVLAGVGVLALLLAAAASWYLARTLARPINDLTAQLAHMADTRDLKRSLPRSGVSREIDALADTFDALRTAVSQAEAESDAAYVGVIGALAAALDARDPYTAGHSQRVASLSVLLAEELGLPAEDRETLRLGALLHDIGKIGISDTVLRKPGKLTSEEVEHIRLHPVLGARILAPIAFLRPHLPVVELHHERPDGQGYPRGLRGDDIPLFARIVHVADAFDAITTARAYRPGRPGNEALAELWQHVGTDFDARVVQAMSAVWDNVLIQSAGAIPIDKLPFRDPNEYQPSTRLRPFIRESRTVA